MKKYLQLIRIKHWIKNFLIFIPLICSGLLNKSNILCTIIGFISFSLASSFVYILNDIKDIENDKKHPRKKNRPLPSGKISKKVAIIISIVCLFLAVIITYSIHMSFNSLSLLFLILYIFINLLYSYGFKNFAIIDIILLASGFVLRVYYGASIIGVEVSSWLFLTIMSASLFLGLGKRKKELINNKSTRKVLKEYNEPFLDKFQYLCLTLTIVFYSLWTLDQGTSYLYFTIPLLIIIFMKYSLILETNDEGDPTTVLYKDKGLLILCVIYAIVMCILLVVI